MSILPVLKGELPRIDVFEGGAT